MKSRSLKEIIKLDSLLLATILDYWEEYTFDTVLNASLELKRRKFNISDNVLKKQEEFCRKNNSSNIEELLSRQSDKTEFQTPIEYFDNKRENILTEIKTKYSNSPRLNPLNIRAAGRAILDIFYCLIFILILQLVSLVITKITTNDDSLKLISILDVVSNITCIIIILVKLYSAGNNLIESANSDI